MKLSDKLDFLQAMAVEHGGNPNKLYLIELLAEHAEDEEVTACLLELVKRLLAYS